MGGQAAAAAHSLGTPLATISVVAKELKKEIGNNKEFSKDIDLLISQSKRCSEILKKISKKQMREDIFLSSIKFEDLLDEQTKHSKSKPSLARVALVTQIENMTKEERLIYSKRLEDLVRNKLK